MAQARLVLLLLPLLCIGAGCAARVSFPHPIDTRPDSDETLYTYDVDNNSKPDYWQYADPQGRKTAIAFADPGGNPGPRIRLDHCEPADCPHVIIALDGVPFRIVEDMHANGHFRLFFPPARVISCFPGMTDLALSQLFHSGRVRSYQAHYFDRQKQRLVGGNDAYLQAVNSPWVTHVDYRCSFLWDILVYLNPQIVFEHELKGLLKTFRKAEQGRVAGYSVGTAGLGTRGSRPAIEQYLRRVDELCELLVYLHRGNVRITLTADHGHNLVENRNLPLKDMLTASGYRLRDVLRQPRDVVAVAYGLVTYIELYTPDAPGVARCLLEYDDVNLALYPEPGAVVVQSRHGLARVRKLPGGYAYEVEQGDPLELQPIIAELQRTDAVSDAGVIDADALFDATVMHTYPDPLARVWEAFFGLVDHPPDLVVNLRDGACYGSRFFHFMIRRMCSTHGSLNRINSTTFAMTMLGQLPSAMRSADVLPALERLRAEQSPSGTTGAEVPGQPTDAAGARR